MAFRFIRLSYKLHPLTWLLVLAVLSLFLWLNFHVTWETYMEKRGNFWRGGLREGFPVAWWDAGMETEIGSENGKLYLNQTPYGGWKMGGICCALALFVIALASTAIGGERVIRIWCSRHQQLARIDANANHGVGIRPVTAFASLLTLAATVTANVVLTTHPSNAPAEVTRTMGWPCAIYVAREPYLVGLHLEDRPASEIVRYIVNHPKMPFRWTDWHMSSVVCNAFLCMLLIICAAWLCEEVLRWEARYLQFRQQRQNQARTVRS
jgi:hypothetical protein